MRTHTTSIRRQVAYAQFEDGTVRREGNYIQEQSNKRWKD